MGNRWKKVKHWGAKAHVAAAYSATAARKSRAWGGAKAVGRGGYKVGRSGVSRGWKVGHDWQRGRSSRKSLMEHRQYTIALARARSGSRAGWRRRYRRRW